MRRTILNRMAMNMINRLTTQKSDGEPSCKMSLTAKKKEKTVDGKWSWSTEHHRPCKQINIDDIEIV